MAAQPALLADGIVVVDRLLSDNGDDDGFADTHETVELRLILRNVGSDSLTGLTARLSSDDPTLLCLTTSEIAIGDLEPGETTVTDPFVFDVSDIDRTELGLGVYDALAATFGLTFAADAADPLAFPSHFRLDLDLDVEGGAGPTTFFEGFEAGFGSFTTMHLDEPLNPPAGDLGNNEAGWLNAMGSLCQYSDPNWAPPNCFDCHVLPEDCFPGVTNMDDTFYFQVTTERSFSDNASMHFGIFLDPVLGFTTPLAQLEAVATTDPIHLGWERICARTSPP